MNWEKYSQQYIAAASDKGISQELISKLLAYAKRLYDQNLPIIFDQLHLSQLVGYSLDDYLLKVTNSSKKFYRTFTIEKKSGGLRKISEPLPSLKEIQKWILSEILYKIKFSDFIKSYVPKRSIKDNAKYHKNSNILLKIDIKDYFPSIKLLSVYSFFKKLGYSKAVSSMLANICCYKNALPQGAPTSPALSNLITEYIDKRIYAFIKQYNIKYTRYADDLSFSGDFEPGMIIKFVKNILKDYDLEINSKKTRVMKPHQRQFVTGIVVNKKMQVPVEMRKKLRQVVYYINKYGLESHLSKINNDKPHYIEHLLGIANHIKHINPKDKHVDSYIKILKKYLNIKVQD